MAFLSRSWANTNELAAPASPPKRISTPAGMRLSVIMESDGNFPGGRPKRNSLFSSKASSNTLIEYPGSIRQSDDLRGGAGGTSGYSYSIFAEKLPHSQGSGSLAGFFNRKGGWKRILILVALLLVTIVAVVVGLVVGLKKSHSSRDSSSAQPAPASGSSPSSSLGSSSNTSPSGTSVAPSSPTSTTISKDFPLGTYSFITSLDDVQTGCTSNALTWTCFPYTLFSTSPTKALTTFNWIISAGSKKSSYQISSSTNPFAINFQNLPLTLVSQGNADERYTFQFQMSKEVIPTGVITNDGSTAKCFYNDTTFSGYLYTKMGKDYPASAQDAGNPAYQPWPFAVRAEQVTASGVDAPTCYEYTNGNLGARVTGNLTVSDPQMLCNCLYRNYQP